MKIWLKVAIGILLLAAGAWAVSIFMGPHEIPVYPGAQNVDRTLRPTGEGKDLVLSFTTHDSPEQIIDFYKAHLGYEYDWCAELFRQYGSGPRNIIWVTPMHHGAGPTQVRVYHSWGFAWADCFPDSQ